MVRALDLQFGGSKFKSPPPPAASWICSQSSRVQFLTMLVNSQLVCSRPLGILNPIMLDLNYICFKHLLVPTSINAKITSKKI